MQRTNIEQLCITASISILDAMRRLNETGRRVLFVTDEMRLEGVLSDGDIRRYILANGDLSQAISKIMKTNPVMLRVHEIHKAKRIFKKRGITAIPVVNDMDCLVDILFVEDLIDSEVFESPSLDLPVVIMAGGEGTRLYPYTKILPKPLIPIGDTPIIERIMRKFGAVGCKRFYVTVNYKKNMIKAYLNEIHGAYDIQYVEESKPLGTGGSLAYLKGIVNETFILSNCDILVNADMLEVVQHHRSKNNIITMIASLRHHVIPYGVIEVSDEGYVSKLVEKPHYNMLVNTGVYIVEPSLLDAIEVGEFVHITQVIERLMAEGMKVGVFPISDDAWFDMGQMDELERMYEHFEKG